MRTKNKRIAAEVQSVPVLVIKQNNAAVNGICPICGELTDPRTPLEIFPDGEWSDVCHACAERLNPPLSRMLDAWYVVGAAEAWMYRGYCEESESGCPF